MQQHLSELERFVEKASCLFVKEEGSEAREAEVQEAIRLLCFWDKYWAVDMQAIRMYLKGDMKI